MTDTVMLVFSFVCFVLAAVPYPPGTPYRENLIAAGLAFWVATLIF